MVLTTVLQTQLFEWFMQDFITEGNQNIYVWAA